MKNTQKPTENDVVNYKIVKGRGRPAVGKILRTRVVCVEILNLNTQRRAFIPMNEVTLKNPKNEARAM